MDMQGVYRNLFAKALKKQFTFVQMTEESSEGHLIAVNENYIAVSWRASLGGVAIFDPKEPRKASVFEKLIKGHKGPIIDLEFYPFRSDLLSTCSEDCTVKLWKIPEGGLKEDLTKELQIFPEHNSKVSFARFNPLASNVISSISLDGQIHVWNILAGKSYSSYDIRESPISFGWNQNGSLLAVSTNNRNINIFDPRAKNLIFNTKLSEGSRMAKFTWIGENSFVSCGFNKKGLEREFRVWDFRKIQDNTLQGPIDIKKIDEQSGIPTPYYDYESKILYICGKGEGNINAFDFNEPTLKKVHNFCSDEGAKAIAMINRRGVDYKTCEVDRFVKYTNDMNLVNISFYVFRRGQEYDRVLFPDIPDGEPSMTYEEWVGGANTPPKKIEIVNLDKKYKSTEEKDFVKCEIKEKKKNKAEIIKELSDKKILLEKGIETLISKNNRLRKVIATNEDEIKQIQEKTKKVMAEVELLYS